MVLGNGMIAQSLMTVDRSDVLYAASGLSNLKGADPAQRNREQALLEAQIRLHQDKLFVYISSYSIDDQDLSNNTPYLAHKLHMENLVRAKADKYLIIRTSNVVGRSRQPGNLMNFIFRHLTTGEPFDIWTGTTRNLIDVAHLAQMADAAIDAGRKNEIVYLTHPHDIPIIDIVRQFEELSGLVGQYALKNKGVHYKSDSALSSALFEKLSLEDDPKQYAKELILRYFGDLFPA